MERCWAGPLVAKSIAMAKPIVMAGHGNLGVGWRRCLAPQRRWPTATATMGGCISCISDPDFSFWAQRHYDEANMEDMTQQNLKRDEVVLTTTNAR